MVPWLFLAATIWGAAFTLNAYTPQRSSRILFAPSFFGGWLTSELPRHHLAWQVVATALFIWAGALNAWPGWAGIAITAVSWAALWHQRIYSDRAALIFEAALQASLGPGYRSEIDADLRDLIDSTPPPPGPASRPHAAPPTTPPCRC